MKVIIFSRPDGGMGVYHPLEGARLAKSATRPDGITVSKNQPVSVDQLVRPWPQDGAAAEWAETESEFIDRIIAEGRVPVSLLDSPERVREKMGANLSAKVTPPTVLQRGDADFFGIAWRESEHWIVDAAALPADRTFREAWKARAGRVEHDMTKCREIHRERLRVERAPQLAGLDIEYQRADEAGDQTAKRRIAAQKQALRDAPANPAIDSARTPEELKAITL